MAVPGIPTLPSEMLPRMDWQAEDKLAAWTFFTQRLTQYFTIAHTPKEDRVTHILFFGGQEASERWETLKEQLVGDDAKDATKVFSAFANSFEKSSTHWQARDEYLGDIKQTKQQTTAELDLYIKDLVRRCQFKQGEMESRKIDLLYHATLHFEVRKFVHNAKPSELSYDRMIEVAKAHERTCQEYQMHKQAHSGGASNYTNPLLQTHALSKSFQKHPPRRPCGKCGRSHGHGDCPAQGATCNSCGKKNHWSTVCRTRRHSSSGRTPSRERPQERQRRHSDKQHKKNGGGGGYRSGSKKATPKRPFKPKTHKQFALKVTEPQLSTPSLPPKVIGVDGKEETVEQVKPAGLSRPAFPPKDAGETFCNSFMCDTLGSIGNEEYDDCNRKYKVYTDTDSDGKTEIITDINVKFQGKAIEMEVKVDPGAETNCIPLSHFRCLFPELCSNGQPKEGALTPSLALFEAYDGGTMRAHGWFILPTQDITRAKKFHPVRYYVLDREDARILISHATAFWLGLVEVKCKNKAPKVKRQVATVTKKQSDTNPRSCLSDPEHPPKVKYTEKSGNISLSKPEHPPKVKYTTHNNKTVTVNLQVDRSPTPIQRSRGRKRRKGKPLTREEDSQQETQHTQPQVTGPSSDAVLGGGNRPTTTGGKTETPSQSEIYRSHNNRVYCKSHCRTSTPSQSEISGKTPKRRYYKPHKDQETYYMNSEGHLQCQQDPQKTIKVSNPQELPGSKEHPIYIVPGSVTITSVDDLIKLYPNSFDRLGSLKGEYDIKVDPTVPPVQHARRKVPIESKTAIEEAIDYMVQQDILEPQIEPTPWVSSVTYPVKSTGEVRPCLDARDLNKAIIRENHKPQTVEEIAHQLAGAVVFTKADALKAFLQVHLTEASSKLLVINTHKGRYRFKRMPFGAKMSQDVFQMKMDLIMEKCPGVISIHDDIVIYGTSDQDHDSNLINLMNVAQLEGLVLNSKKLELKRPRVSFFGAEYSADGMHPCPKKIQGITEMTPPTDKQQLASFIGMVTYMGNFVPHLSHHTEPLRAMLKQDAIFNWDPMANDSFQRIKNLIAKTANQPLKYYDRTKPVTVQADASQRGLGACLIQDGQPIAFASKSLTDTETRYANIERELLAIVFACQRFNTYVLGRPFTVESDHKPLEMIHQKSLASAPPRLQRMLLQLQRYDLVIRYKPGKEMLLADAMSRCPSHSSEEIKLDMRVDYIAFNKAWIAKLKEATWEDPILSTVYQLTQQGWPHQRRHTPRMARHYWDFRDELSIDDGLLLKGQRIAIPACLREEYLQRLHHGHLSATKVQQNARQHLYWPGLDADIIDYTRRCQECIKRSLPPKEPLQAHDVPQQPWERIAMDYFYSDGKLYILICDYFSKFPFLFQTRTTAWTSLKAHLTELFAIEGTPDEVMTDNGPPFNGKEFSEFLSGLGIRHSTSSPNYPQSNGFIERQVQTVKRLMAKATATGRSFQEALTGLRAQPLGDGLPSPAEILHGRSLTTRKATPVDIKAVRDTLISLQAKYIKGHDKARRARAQRQLVTGEEVYYLSSNDNWLLGLITGTRDTGRSYDVLAGDGTLLRRNRSHLKPRSFDIPVIRANMNARTATPSQSDKQNISLAEPEHPPKVKYTTHNNENISLPPKAPKLVIKRIGDTSYDSYIAETLVPLKSAFKPKKQTRFADQPVTSVKAIPPRRRPHPPKWNRDAADPDLLIPIELSQPRAVQDQDPGGNLSVDTEETLPKVPLGQSQAQEGNSSSEHSIASSDTETPSQSEIFSEPANIQNIQYNNRYCETPSQREIFSETGTGSSSEELGSNTDSGNPEESSTSTRSHSDQQDSHSDGSSETPSQSEIYKYTENIVDSNACSTSTSSQSEIYSSNTEYEAGSEVKQQGIIQTIITRGRQSSDQESVLAHPSNGHGNKILS